LTGHYLAAYFVEPMQNHSWLRGGNRTIIGKLESYEMLAIRSDIVRGIRKAHLDAKLAKFLRGSGL
jgi:hypothetical protein